MKSLGYLHRPCLPVGALSVGSHQNLVTYHQVMDELGCLDFADLGGAWSWLYVTGSRSPSEE